jgi:hypothetical protein
MINTLGFEQTLRGLERVRGVWEKKTRQNELKNRVLAIYNRLQTFLFEPDIATHSRSNWAPSCNPIWIELERELEWTSRFFSRHPPFELNLGWYLEQVSLEHPFEQKSKQSSRVWFLLCFAMVHLNWKLLTSNQRLKNWLFTTVFTHSCILLVFNCFIYLI